MKKCPKTSPRRTARSRSWCVPKPPTPFPGAYSSTFHFPTPPTQRSTCISSKSAHIHPVRNILPRPRLLRQDPPKRQRLPASAPPVAVEYAITYWFGRTHARGSICGFNPCDFWGPAENRWPMLPENRSQRHCGEEIENVMLSDIK